MTLQEQIIQELEQVPDSLLSEILDFILFTKVRHQVDGSPRVVQKTSASVEDPLADFVGAVSSGTLAQAIDETLYE